MSSRTILRSLAALAAFAVCAGTRAEAADLASFFGLQQQNDPAEPTQPVEFGTGWYIRGDTAYAEDSLPGISPALQAITSGRQPNFNADLGFGYKINDWIRTDIVADYWLPTKSQGDGPGIQCVTQLNGTPPIPAQTVFDTCTPHGNSSIQRLDALANVYVDIGTWSGFTPYVGGGLGMSRLQVTNDVNYFMSNGLPYHISTDGFFFNFDRSSDSMRYQFASALMAGVSYQINPELYLDVGYRYINLGTINGLQDANGNSISKTMDAHEARIGLRYMIDQQ